MIFCEKLLKSSILSYKITPKETKFQSSVLSFIIAKKTCYIVVALRNPENAPHARTSQVTTKMGSARTSQLATSHRTSASCRRSHALKITPRVWGISCPLWWSTTWAWSASGAYITGSAPPRVRAAKQAAASWTSVPSYLKAKCVKLFRQFYFVTSSWVQITKTRILFYPFFSSNLF